LQRRAKAAAGRAGMKLGGWVSAAIERSLSANAALPDIRIPAKGADTRGIERRRPRLESAAINGKTTGPKLRKKPRAAATAVNPDTPQFRALVKQLFIQKLHGAPRQRIQDALGVSEEIAQALSEVHA